MVTRNRQKGERIKSTPQQAIGQSGEDQALSLLLANGLMLVTRNFRSRRGEIDLIMRDGETLVFVEVRKRKNNQFGGAMASVTSTKQARLVGAANAFMQKLPSYPPCRFDVVAVEGQSVEWLKNAIET